MYDFPLLHEENAVSKGNSEVDIMKDSNDTGGTVVRNPGFNWGWPRPFAGLSTSAWLLTTEATKVWMIGERCMYRRGVTRAWLRSRAGC